MILLAQIITATVPLMKLTADNHKSKVDAQLLAVIAQDNTDHP
jgi:hypothetical protein